MISVEQKVKIYEIGGSKVPDLEHPTLIVKSDWATQGMIILEIGIKGKENYTILADDLKVAIENATNVNRH